MITLSFKLPCINNEALDAFIILRSLCCQNKIYEKFFIYCHGNMERIVLVSVMMFVLRLEEKNYKPRLSVDPLSQPDWQTALLGSPSVGHSEVLLSQGT